MKKKQKIVVFALSFLIILLIIFAFSQFHQEGDVQTIVQSPEHSTENREQLHKDQQIKEKSSIEKEVSNDEQEEKRKDAEQKEIIEEKNPSNKDSRPVLVIM